MAVNAPTPLVESSSGQLITGCDEYEPVLETCDSLGECHDFLGPG